MTNAVFKPNKRKPVEYQPMIGAHIKDAIREIIALVAARNQTHFMNFNGLPLVVLPGDSFDAIYRAWETAQDPEDFPNKCPVCCGIGACPQCWGRAAITKLEQKIADLESQIKSLK